MANERYNWINAKNLTYDSLNKSKPKPLIDKEVSQIVGKKVFVNDPRLIKLVIKWRNSKNPDNDDNYLKNADKREELKRVFNPENYQNGENVVE